jgi:hypothetical protein
MLELLDLTGRVDHVPLAEVRMVSFVRDFNTSDTVNPERLLRKTFLARPRGEGLWLRLTFHDGDVLEGLAPTDRSLLDSIAEDGGVQMVPPDTRSNTQRIFVPRLAIETMEVAGVIGGIPRRPEKTKAEAKPSIQEDLLFELPPNSRPN